MTFTQLWQVAQQKPNLKFQFTNKKGQVKSGVWVDADKGLFRFKGMPTNQTISVQAWRSLYKNEDFEWEIMN